MPKKILCCICLCMLMLTLTACGQPPRVMAQDRMFLNLSMEFLGEYQLPKTDYENTKVGGLSGITYNPQTGKYYAISDDRSQKAPARFYTLNVSLKTVDDKVSLEKVEIENVTFLSDGEGKNYPEGSVDLEGIALSPRQSFFISSEGIPSKSIPPFIQEYDVNSGKYIQSVRIPDRYIPDAEKTKGVQENLGFEALMLNPSGLAAEDPFRLFTAPESALIQDNTLDQPEQSARIRMMHYVINPFGDPVLVAEHLYLLDPAPSDSLSNGLTELLALKTEGYFLSLERSFGLSGVVAKIYQVVVANATDTSRIANLSGDITLVEPLKKQLVLDLSQLGIELDNLEAMTFGPNLPDGSRTLLLVSDDNFKDNQVNQFLLFRLVEK